MHSPNCSMYNDLMPTDSYEIRVCNSCGLRYPLVDEQTFGTRCPACLGETRVALSRKLIVEPGPTRPLGTLPKSRETSSKESRFGEGRGWALATLLDNIRSAWNVGSILRCADGFGFAYAYLCGITPTPENDIVQKTSLGAEDSVRWSYHKDAVKLVNGLKQEGWKIIALEEDERAIAITDASTAGLDTISKNTRSTRPSAQREVLIVGNEVTGVDPELLDLCDTIYSIPMHGQKRSFNVAIAFGIAAYTIR
jgi:23S rRNA (guanosine2251-2'-O)-methyltransferase